MLRLLLGMLMRLIWMRICDGFSVLVCYPVYVKQEADNGWTLYFHRSILSAGTVYFGSPQIQFFCGPSPTIKLPQFSTVPLGYCSTVQRYYTLAIQSKHELRGKAKGTV